MGRSEVGAAEGTTREGTAKCLKSVASVSVVLSTVAHSQLLTSLHVNWAMGQKGESGGKQGQTGSHRSPSTCSLHLLGEAAIALLSLWKSDEGKVLVSGSSQLSKWAKFNTTYSMAEKNHTLKLFLRTVHSVS